MIKKQINESLIDESLRQLYIRNGFRDTGVGRTFDGTAMTILMNGEGTFIMQDYDDALNELYASLQTIHS